MPPVSSWVSARSTSSDRCTCSSNGAGGLLRAAQSSHQSIVCASASSTSSGSGGSRYDGYQVSDEVDRLALRDVELGDVAQVRRPCAAARGRDGIRTRRRQKRRAVAVRAPDAPTASRRRSRSGCGATSRKRTRPAEPAHAPHELARRSCSGMNSSTSASPSSVRHSVRSTKVPGRYARSTCERRRRRARASSARPPAIRAARRTSSAESKRGMHSQSIAPAREMSAAVCRSPISA